jgi:hypothetical protein
MQAFSGRPDFLYGLGQLRHRVDSSDSPKGKSNWRWLVGMKLGWLMNDSGEVVPGDHFTANVHDQSFLPLTAPYAEQTIVLADSGFQDADGVPTNLKLCPRGTWNERMLVETTLSLVTLVFGCLLRYHDSRGLRANGYGGCRTVKCGGMREHHLVLPT